MRISAINNYNRLFSSLPVYSQTYSKNTKSKNNMSNLTGNVLGVKVELSGINISDYAAIKNGSYSKLLKSYYNMKKEKTSLEKEPISIDKIIIKEEDL